MGDLARDWAGVLARWGGGAGAGQLKEAGSGPGTVLASYNRDPGQQHASSTRPAEVTRSSLVRRDSSLGQKPGGRDTGDRQQHSAAPASAQRAASSSGPRPRWSHGSSGRGSVSPGKENTESGGYRSRSATRSPSSRLFSSTVASRAKQIQAGPGQEQSRRQRPSAGRPAHPQPRPSSSPPLRRSPRPSKAPAPGGGGRVSQDRGRAAPLQSYSDFRQVAEAGAGARSHAVHRSASTGRKQSSASSSSEVRRSAGAGVKISLASLKKATVDTWGGQEDVGGAKQGKRKSVSSVYIG